MWGIRNLGAGDYRDVFAMHTNTLGTALLTRTVVDTLIHYFILISVYLLMEATHDPTRCHELLRSMGALYEDLKSSYADCARLLERCIFLLPIVSEEAESSPIEFVELLQLMRDIRAYCGTFRQVK